jgi:hypothetical protein
MHRTRVKRHGDPSVTKHPGRELTTLQMFERNVKKGTVDTDCWEWQAARHSSGYGQLRRSGRAIYMHRWSYEHHNGPIPDGMLIRHSCDNPPCVNPAHLLLGTERENMADAVERGRASVAERHSRKLTNADVVTIRACIAAGEKQAHVARRFGIAESTVSEMMHGRTWKSVAW